MNGDVVVALREGRGAGAALRVRGGLLVLGFVAGIEVAVVRVLHRQRNAAPGMEADTGAAGG